MKDEQGLYYHPSLQDRDARMYVRDNMGRIEFRLWNRQDPGVWERHGWLSLEIVKAAAEMFKSRDTGRNPLALYDLDVAKRLLMDGE